MKRFILAEASYIGSTLLAAGSIVTEEDLGEDRDGKKTEAGSALIEVNAKGQPTNKADADRLRDIGISTVPVEVAPVSPHAPNPTAPQALPAHAVGEPLPPGQFVPAEGVESDEAAEARAEQQAAAEPTPQRRKK